MLRFLLLSILIITFHLKSQIKIDKVVGYYRSPEENSIFKFYESNNKYFAKIVWMKRPGRIDSLNPDKSKRNQKILGMTVVNNFIQSGENEWIKGTIYDPNDGKTYHAKITNVNNEYLKIRGYIGLSWFGKTNYFKKVNFKETD